jgi:hypothetical protein
MHVIGLLECSSGASFSGVVGGDSDRVEHTGLVAPVSDAFTSTGDGSGSKIIAP